MTFSRLASSVLFAAPALCVLVVQAQERPSEVNSSPSTISNAQTAPLVFHLKATPVAPAGAAGSAELKNGSLSLHLSQIDPGSYVIEGLSRPDLPPYRLSVIVISDPTRSPDRIANDNKKEASANPESVHLETDVQITLPPELRSLQIGHLRLLGPGGNAVLEGKAE